MAVATLSSKGQITVPKEVRDALGLTPGSRVSFLPNGDGDYVLSIAARPLAQLAGSLRYDGPPLTLDDMDAAIGMTLLR